MIIIPVPVYRKMLKYALTGANPKSRKSWKEVAGVLIGRMGNPDIEVTDVVFLGSGNAVFVDIVDYSKIPFEQLTEGKSIVAWWHSHPGLGLFLSGTDVRTQSFYQQLDPRAFALVIDPSLVTYSNPGIKVFQVHGYEYIEIAHMIENKADFFQIKMNLTTELYEEKGIVEIIPLITLTPAILDRVQLTVSCEPNSCSSEYELKIIRRGEPNMFLGVKYDLSVLNLLLVSNFLSTSFTHKSNEEGTLAFLRFKKINPGPGEIKLNNVIMWNSIKEKSIIETPSIRIP